MTGATDEHRIPPEPLDPTVALDVLESLRVPLALLRPRHATDGTIDAFEFCYLNGEARAYLEVGPDGGVGARLADLLPADTAEQAFGWCHDVLTTGTPQEGESAELAVLRNGAPVRTTVDYRVVRVDAGVCVTWCDRSTTPGETPPFSDLIEHAADAILVVADNGDVLIANAEAERLFGRSRDAIVGRSVEALLPERFRTAHAGHRARFAQGRARRAMGVGHELLAATTRGETPVEVSLVPLSLGGGNVTIATVRDVTERHVFEQRLRDLADHDPLSGLFNRRRFKEELERHLALVPRYATSSAVLLIDLDGFKDVNDTLGHAVGDWVLRDVSRVLRQTVRSSDIIARLGGDEFVVLLPFADEQSGLAAADQIRAALSAGGLGSASAAPVRVTASIGVFVIDRSSAPRSWEEVMARADVALYTAKEHGRNRVVAYHPELRYGANVHERVVWSQRLHDALERDGLELFAQPIADTSRPNLVYAEVLLRLRDADGTLHTPDRFLPVAAQVGLMRRVDRWVVSRAFELSRDHPDARIAVNLSAESLTDNELVSEIAEAARTRTADLSRIVFELTETAAVKNLQETAKLAHRLRHLGASISLDDFGAGFGTFAYLKHLPFDQLKIDGTFVRRLTHEPDDQVLVRAMVDIAEGLGKTLVAEWVEDEATMAMLEEFGITLMQGYVIGPPAPAADVLGARRG